MEELIKKISNRPDCHVFDAVGLPEVEDCYKLPEDLEQFYKLCGGMTLFKDSAYGFTVLPPEEFKPINPILIGERGECDISSNWYALCQTDNGEYISIDLRPDKLGYCYDSSMGRHAIQGSCDIIAKSFTQLILNFLENGGESFYWCEPDFEYLGDAYDE